MTLHDLILSLDRSADGYHPSHQYEGSRMRITLREIALQLKAIEAREVALIAEWRRFAAELKACQPQTWTAISQATRLLICADQLESLISSPLSAQKEQA